ncbi:MAG: DUF2969 domain-containing protein [Lactobacillales bacterium]|jgi:hypothetical protein|nr:DUF2969 domain-containing protein [Lactobacillales bacterium]
MSKKKIPNVEVKLDDIRFTFNDEEVDAVEITFGKHPLATIVEHANNFHLLYEGEAIGNYKTFDNALQTAIELYNLDN